jgi:nitrogen fixation/metabolism regulation signal transduction histidine kinase
MAMLNPRHCRQIGELIRLVGDFVELARGDGQEEPLTLVDLNALKRRVVDVAVRDHQAITFRIDLAPRCSCPVSRAVLHLIDNASRGSPPGQGSGSRSVTAP